MIAAAQATAQTSDTGRTAVHDTARAMDAIREQAEAVAGNIVALSEKTQPIGDIIATVNDVSERSHLLALNASTMHRLLGWRPDSHSRFRHNRSNRLPHDVVIVDETSMVSLSLMARLVEAVRPGLRTAFSWARRPATPQSRAAGRPTTWASGRTSRGAIAASPMKIPNAPRPIPSIRTAVETPSPSVP